MSIDSEVMQLKNGGRKEIFVIGEATAIARTIVQTYRINAMVTENIALGKTISTDGGVALNTSEIKDKSLERHIHLPACAGGRCGGIRVPHVHLDGETYILTDKQWDEFSKGVMGSFQKKLANAKGVSFEKLMELSDVMTGIVSYE